VGFVFACAFPARAQTHAPWPSDWNNWNDPALWVTVGNPGNAPDMRYASPGYGAVNYTFRTGKFEVTAGQYTEFLNAVAKTDTYGLYSTYMDTLNFSFGCNIVRSESPGNCVYSVATDWGNRPVSIVSWGDAARFANWLTNGEKTGSQDMTTTENGSYYLNGATKDADLMKVTRIADGERLPGKKYYFIPTEDEWYKAAYHTKDGVTGNYWDYPTGSNTIPSNVLSYTETNNANFYADGYTIDTPYYRTEVGAFAASPSAYGTFDQGGNVDEWNEAIVNGSCRRQRGGNFYQQVSHLQAAYSGHYDYPSHESWSAGLRLVEVPEPATLSLLVLGVLALLRRCRGFKG
jgi:formylglycine-generating enzyme required for sulfatase activity